MLKLLAKLMNYPISRLEIHPDEAPTWLSRLFTSGFEMAFIPEESLSEKLNMFLMCGIVIVIEDFSCLVY
jgi:hypothetical protein